MDNNQGMTKSVVNLSEICKARVLASLKILKTQPRNLGVSRKDLEEKILEKHKMKYSTGSARDELESALTELWSSGKISARKCLTNIPEEGIFITSCGERELETIQARRRELLQPA